MKNILFTVSKNTVICDYNSNEWNYWALVINKESFSIYKNGELAVQKITRCDVSVPKGLFNLGKGSISTYRINDLRSVNASLSSTKIKALYNLLKNIAKPLDLPNYYLGSFKQRTSVRDYPILSRDLGIVSSPEECQKLALSVGHRYYGLSKINDEEYTCTSSSIPDYAKYGVGSDIHVWKYIKPVTFSFNNLDIVHNSQEYEKYESNDSKVWSFDEKERKYKYYTELPAYYKTSKDISTTFKSSSKGDIINIIETDFTGYPYSEFYTNDEWECRDSCEKDDNCRLYTFNTTGVCRLYSDIPRSRDGKTTNVHNNAVSSGLKL